MNGMLQITKRPRACETQFLSLLNAYEYSQAYRSELRLASLELNMTEFHH